LPRSRDLFPLPAVGLKKMAGDLKKSVLPTVWMWRREISLVGGKFRLRGLRKK